MPYICFMRVLENVHVQYAEVILIRSGWLEAQKLTETGTGQLNRERLQPLFKAGYSSIKCVSMPYALMTLMEKWQTQVA